MTAVRASTRPAGLTGTLAVHGLVVVALVLFAQRAPAPSPVVYAVELIAAPAPQETPRRAAAEATPVAEAETAPILPPKQKVKPEPVKPKPANQVKVEDKVPVTKAPVTPIPNTTPSTGRDVVTLSQAGMQFPFPEYLRNITNQIYLRWRQPLVGTNLHAEVSFVILRDGSVKDPAIAVSSGRDDFDLNALGAVELSGRARAFGPLPSGFVGDELPISFYFAPTRRP
ncbi:MAG: TonB C-terminal domain-containing protein [Gemmatimonadota bacterium]